MPIKRFKINYKRLFIFFIITLLSWVVIRYSIFWILKTPLFLVNNIDSDIAIDANLKEDILGQSLFQLNLKKIYIKVKENNPQVKEAFISKVLPSVLKIRTIKRKPFAQIKKEGFYLIDDEYKILDKQEESPYKDIWIIDLGWYVKPLKIGMTLKDKRIKLAGELIKSLKKSRLIDKFEIDTINAVDINSLSFFIGEVNILVGEGDFDRKLALLEKTLENKFDNKVDSLLYVDLRYIADEENIYIGNKR